MSGSGDDTLLTELRRMVGASSTQYELDGVSYWTDEQLLIEIEKSAILHSGKPVELQSYEAPGGEYAAKLGQLASVGFISPDEQGVVFGYDGEAVEAEIGLRGEVSFAEDIYELSPLTWDGTSYDLHGAAARILDAWVAVVSTVYDVTIDGQSLDRSQMVKQLRDQADHHRSQAVGASAAGRIATVPTEAPL